jgi:hypothetical protein
MLVLAVAATAAAVTEKAGRPNLPAAAPDPYAADPEPMTVAECGRCHRHQFKALKDEGGAHRFACTDCHEVFHAWNPRKNNFAELMPKCGNCHGLAHGEKQTDCLSCHADPHAPRARLSLHALAGNCGDCHRQPAEQLQEFPSAHSGQACQDCHSQRHGRIPTCFECHEAHFPKQALATCLACHPAHKPRETLFAADSDAATCAACHDAVFLKWSKTPSRHGQVNCTVCHGRHGSLPACTDCHQPPHSPQMTAKFKSCLGCHLDPHNLPVK